MTTLVTVDLDSSLDLKGAPSVFSDPAKAGQAPFGAITSVLSGTSMLVRQKPRSGAIRCTLGGGQMPSGSQQRVRKALMLAIIASPRTSEAKGPRGPATGEQGAEVEAELERREMAKAAQDGSEP